MLFDTADVTARFLRELENLPHMIRENSAEIQLVSVGDEQSAGAQEYGASAFSTSIQDRQNAGEGRPTAHSMREKLMRADVTVFRELPSNTVEVVLHSTQNCVTVSGGGLNLAVQISRSTAERRLFSAALAAMKCFTRGVKILTASQLVLDLIAQLQRGFATLNFAQCEDLLLGLADCAKTVPVRFGFIAPSITRESPLRVGSYIDAQMIQLDEPVQQLQIIDIEDENTEKQQPLQSVPAVEQEQPNVRGQSSETQPETTDNVASRTLTEEDDNAAEKPEQLLQHVQDGAEQENVDRRMETDFQTQTGSHQESTPSEQQPSAQSQQTQPLDQVAEILASVLPDSEVPMVQDEPRQQGQLELHKAEIGLTFPSYRFKFCTYSEVSALGLQFLSTQRDSKTVKQVQIVDGIKKKHPAQLKAFKWRILPEGVTADINVFLGEVGENSVCIRLSGANADIQQHVCVHGATHIRLLAICLFLLMFSAQEGTTIAFGSTCKPFVDCFAKQLPDLEGDKLRTYQFGRSRDLDEIIDILMEIALQAKRLRIRVAFQSLDAQTAQEIAAVPESIMMLYDRVEIAANEEKRGAQTKDPLKRERPGRKPRKQKAPMVKKQPRKVVAEKTAKRRARRQRKTKEQNCLDNIIVSSTEDSDISESYLNTMYEQISAKEKALPHLLTTGPADAFHQNVHILIAGEMTLQEQLDLQVYLQRYRITEMHFKIQ